MKQFIDTILFARSPVLGKVKQRLAGHVGDKRALAVYRKLLRLSLRAALEAVTMDSELRLVLSHLGPRPDADIPKEFLGTFKAQTSDEFAANLAAEVQFPVLAHRRGVVVFGADHPTIEAGHIITIAHLLDRHPVAIGPTDDGGFWAVATTVPLSQVIAELPLSTDSACDTFLSVMAKQGLSCGIGPSLFDVDDHTDLVRWKKTIKERNI
ncbi:MAG: DUF2064 domain-containing protein [Deltaproteobacteria bacterium]|nr:DUF2064 domain-containing protein [Deltaproteobacteria bacterium]